MEVPSGIKGHSPGEGLGTVTQKLMQNVEVVYNL